MLVKQTTLSKTVLLNVFVKKNWKQKEFSSFIHSFNENNNNNNKRQTSSMSKQSIYIFHYHHSFNSSLFTLFMALDIYFFRFVIIIIMMVIITFVEKKNSWIKNENKKLVVTKNDIFKKVYCLLIIMKNILKEMDQNTFKKRINTNKQSEPIILG